MGRRAAAIYSMVQTCRLNEIRDNRSVRALGAFPSGSCNARTVGGLSNGRLPIRHRVSFHTIGSFLVSEH
jgi:hypothetical protein